MSKYFKGKFLLSKIIATIVLIGLIVLTQYGVISNILNGLFMLMTLIVFFLVDSNFRENEEYN